MLYLLITERPFLKSTYMALSKSWVSGAAYTVSEQFPKELLQIRSPEMYDHEKPSNERYFRPIWWSKLPPLRWDKKRHRFVVIPYASMHMVLIEKSIKQICIRGIGRKASPQSARLFPRSSPPGRPWSSALNTLKEEWYEKQISTSLCLNV